MSTDIGAIFVAPALAVIARHTPVPASMCSLLQASAVRLIDSAMVITDPCSEFAMGEDSRAKTPLPDFPVLNAVRQLLEQIAAEGFGPHAINFFGLLGSLMIQMSGRPDQVEQVNAWVAEGKSGTFCMTDRGGPLAYQWRSEAGAGSDARLTVDKVWAMNACEADFLIVIVRRGKSMVLSPVIIPPQASASAQRSVSGPAFLDGHLTLGDLRWEGELDPTWVLGQGGPIVPKMFLTQARPWLIQALCAHAQWLARQQRLRLDAAAQECIAFLVEAARNQVALGSFDRFSEDQAMALKWMANELWLSLVVNGGVASLADQRDLLGFTKMEGSSYRCFREIYERNRRFRNAGA
jgi:hypothetical protein